MVFQYGFMLSCVCILYCNDLILLFMIYISVNIFYYSYVIDSINAYCGDIHGFLYVYLYLS